VSWNDAIVVSAGKMRKLWDFLREMRSSVWKTTGKDSSEACAIACQNGAVYSVFRSGKTSHSKIAQFNCECIAPSTLTFETCKKETWIMWGALGKETATTEGNIIATFYVLKFPRQCTSILLVKVVWIPGEVLRSEEGKLTGSGLFWVWMRGNSLSSTVLCLKFSY
jgi:hypothetical protein